MEYRVLGRTGIEVSALCFGTMTFGREADEPTSAALYRRAREAGINFFDCANVYAGGESERILGRLVAEERDRIVLTSKVCMSVGEGLNQRGLSRRHIMQAVEDSLRRLGTDRLDVYFAHHVDARTPLEQTLRAFDDLVRQGKVLHAAVSNWEAWRTAKALGLAERHGWAPIAVLQPMYNLVKRQAEVEILPLAAAEGLGVITYSPLGGGLLTGKYRGGTKPDEGRLTRQANYATQLRHAGLPRGGRAVRRPCRRARRGPGLAGGGVGDAPSGGDRADHRGAAPGATGTGPRRRGRGPDRRMAAGAVGDVDRAAAGDGSAGGAGQSVSPRPS